MTIHLYEVGSIVAMQSDGTSLSHRGRYRVEARMPPLGNHPQYRIKSEAEGFSRVVVEHQLSLFGGTATVALAGGSGALHRGEEN